MLHPELVSDYAFPSLPGSHLNLTNPVLQLVKSIMQVLSLDKTINLEVRLLRKDLLAKFEVREFSAEGQFVNPSTSLRVSQVFCSECTLVRDLDLCKDEDGMPAPGSEHGTSPLPQWSCPACSTPYSYLAIQECLVADVQKVALRWATQDLKCVKCAKLRINDFMEHCSCAGEWITTVKREDMVRRLTVYGNLARYYGFSMVEDVVKGVGLGT